MKFIATTSTDDGRLTNGKIYYGNLVYVPVGLRVAVFDNKGEWMTFSPSAFLPSDLLTSAMRPVSPE